jgi:hypothetical protein
MEQEKPRGPEVGGWQESATVASEVCVGGTQPAGRGECCSGGSWISLPWILRVWHQGWQFLAPGLAEHLLEVA